MIKVMRDSPSTKSEEIQAILLVRCDFGRSCSVTEKRFNKLSVALQEVGVSPQHVASPRPST